MSSNRIDKINSLMLREISGLMGTLKDPRISGFISVTDVKTSGDFRHADVLVSIYGSQNPKETFQVISASAGYFRSELAKTLSIRIVPQLHFIKDDSMEYSRKISDLIENTAAQPETDNKG
jgi:ribosome-binding factor A